MVRVVHLVVHRQMVMAHLKTDMDHLKADTDHQAMDHHRIARTKLVKPADRVKTNKSKAEGNDQPKDQTIKVDRVVTDLEEDKVTDPDKVMDLEKDQVTGRAKAKTNVTNVAS
jgi:hypothetical protein